MTLERLLSSTAGLATPALVVDLEVAERNIAAAGVRLRPHLKAHKCTELMRRQLAGGDCAGVTCATAWEAEIAARAGLHDDILVANEVADPAGSPGCARAAGTRGSRSRSTAPAMSSCSPASTRRADRDQRRPAPLRAGPGRRGRDRGAGRRAGERFRGLQGYEGHAVLLPERPAREEQVERAATILSRLRGGSIASWCPAAARARSTSPPTWTRSRPAPTSCWTRATTSSTCRSSSRSAAARRSSRATATAPSATPA